MPYRLLQEPVTFPPKGQRRNAPFLVVVYALMLLVVLFAAGAGCAPPAMEKRFTDLLERYPGSDEPLAITPLSKAKADELPAWSRGGDIVIMVHPGYSLFFRSRERNIHSETKYDLLKLQMDAEAASIRKMAASGQPLILVIPGNYQRDSVAPGSYVHFLNTLTNNSPSVYYITSESANSGGLSTDTMVMLYRYLTGMGVGRVLIGGGYVGRCEREFHNQLLTYFDDIRFFVVPELSSVSPDDVDDDEALDILNSLRQNDFTPILRIINEKTPKIQTMDVDSMKPAP